MSIRKSDIVIELCIAKWDIEVWADPGQLRKIRRIPGVADVFEKVAKAHYHVEIDHRYDKQSVIDEIVQKCS